MGGWGGGGDCWVSGVMMRVRKFEMRGWIFLVFDSLTRGLCGNAINRNDRVSECQLRYCITLGHSLTICFLSPFSHFSQRDITQSATTSRYNLSSSCQT